ncbi:hypothetical protein N7G274_005141 [Stereocaulon virgatum]|uniref:BTB domain-containing protein n=1 Tax=Stereocaulon virgatum TaxID=373712 RepID=A0ABR4A8E8_9LECA
MICLHNDRDNADMMFVCGSITYNVHSFVLLPRSTFFEVAFRGGFKKTNTNALSSWKTIQTWSTKRSVVATPRTNQTISRIHK